MSFGSRTTAAPSDYRNLAIHREVANDHLEK